VLPWRRGQSTRRRNIADPVGSGFVASLARPGGNVTGFLTFEYSLSGKWLELLTALSMHSDDFPADSIFSPEEIGMERTGVITFLNIHDYVSNISGRRYDGCLAELEQGDAQSVMLYTTSQRLQAALIMSYITKSRVTVSIAEKADVASDIEGGLSPFEGPFTVKAVWNRPAGT
jgi:hypothetical protein